MLVQIGARPPAQDVLGRMLECHERIRRFSTLACKLAAADLPKERFVTEAESVLRYFSTSYVLHARDEEDSLRPRLAGRDSALDEVLGRLAGEHHALDAALAPVLGGYRGLLSAERPDARALAGPSESFRDLAERHLKMEEADLFPAARRLLDSRALEEVEIELRARRSA